MKKKKNNPYENVVINNVELMPTTIGECNKKEGNPFIVLFIFIFLIVLILILPNLTTWIDNLKGSNTSVTNTPIITNPNNETKEEDNKETMDVEYLDLSNPVEKMINNYRFNAQIDNNQLTLMVTNVNGAVNMFVNTPYYLELYSSEHKLLQRIKIAKEEIVASVTYNYSLTSEVTTNNKVLLVITDKNESDYPAVNLKVDETTNNPYLTCTKDNETLIYSFDEDYNLSKIKDRLVVSGYTQDTLTTYESLANAYSSIEGVTSNVNGVNNNLVLETEIDLSKVDLEKHTKVLNNEAFYKTKTPAKTINFELESSYYTCE